ncbi:DivIVA domain-containing protein [Arsenicicoccus dermatophilus]|uniref:DivIVA domain-containing protein n=1 Tax=Arsenicicoccus dermatophilus TaxID=1076331 RepID=UPI001F4CF129|nr:DivIVA domain-containing protein [Arsenicicoccus dermatophilus]
MSLPLILLAVLVVGALTGAVVWLTGTRPAAMAEQALADPVSGSPFEPLPAGPLDPAAVRELRFDQVLRGYRMDQVDEVLERLVGELRERDAEIARLRGDAPVLPDPGHVGEDGEGVLIGVDEGVEARPVAPAHPLEAHLPPGEAPAPAPRTPLDPATHPDVTTGPLDVSEFYRPTDSSSLWSRRDRGEGGATRREHDERPTHPADPDHPGPVDPLP